MNFNKIFAICWFGFFSIGFLICLYSILPLVTGEKTIGTVIDRSVARDGESDYFLRRMTTLSYSIAYMDSEGVKHTKINSSNGIAMVAETLPAPSYTKGDQVSVYYDKSNPDHAIVLSLFLFLNPFIFLVGLILGFLGVIAYKRKSLQK